MKHSAMVDPDLAVAPEIFRRLVQAFDRSAIPYCILAGYDAYPDAIASDVDFMVSPEYLPQVPALLARVAADCDAHLIQCISHETSAAWHVIARLDGARLLCLQPDASSDYRRNGRLWLGARKLLTRRRHHPKGFYVPAAADAFAYYLIKKIDKGGLGEAEAAQLSARYAEDRGGCARELRKLLPASEACMIEWAACSGDWSKVRSELPRLRKQMNEQAKRESWRTYLQQQLAEMARRFDRLVRPSGMSIAFLGPDGCGKSSVIEALAVQLRPAFRSIAVRHLRCGVLPASIRMHPEGPVSGAAPVTDPHRQPLRGQLGSMAKLLYFWLDYLLGSIMRIWPRKVRSTLILFDRHYHDILADPRRYRYGGPMALARLLGRIVPQPDLVFVLDAPASVVRTRKQEVSAAESKRQRMAYLDLVGALRNVQVIDASQPLQGVVESVLQQIIEALESRTAQRLGLMRLQAPRAAQGAHPAKYAASRQAAGTDPQPQSQEV